MTWYRKLKKRKQNQRPIPERGVPLYAVHSAQRGYFAPDGVVWYDSNRELADAQCQTCEQREPYGWRVVPLKIARRGIGPSEVKG